MMTESHPPQKIKTPEEESRIKSLHEAAFRFVEEVESTGSAGNRLDDGSVVYYMRGFNQDPEEITSVAVGKKNDSESPFFRVRSYIPTQWDGFVRKPTREFVLLGDEISCSEIAFNYDEKQGRDVPKEPVVRTNQGEDLDYLDRLFSKGPKLIAAQEKFVWENRKQNEDQTAEQSRLATGSLFKRIGTRTLRLFVKQ